MDSWTIRDETAQEQGLLKQHDMDIRTDDGHADVSREKALVTCDHLSGLDVRRSGAVGRSNKRRSSRCKLMDTVCAKS